jgi:hypothetical protein
LAYLDELGISTADAVSLVVITHWDDDHVQGIGKVVATCSEAVVVCSAALQREDIFQFVIEQEAASGAHGSGLDELRTILRLCHARDTRILWAKANLPLHPSPPGDKPTVVALSPSEDAVERSIEALIEAATALESAVPRRYKAPEGPNGASVVTSVRGDDVTLLLGADLETSPNKETGWDAVLRYATPSIPASIVKVPHHGSPGAHHDGIWSDLAEERPVAVVTPWSKGKNFLPAAADLERLRKITDRLYLSATPSLARARKDSEVRKFIKKVHGERIEELRGWGHVRARRRPAEHEWRVELDGDAAEITA